MFEIPPNTLRVSNGPFRYWDGEITYLVTYQPMAHIHQHSRVEELEQQLSHLIERVAYMSSNRIIFEAICEDSASQAIDLTKEYSPYSVEISDKWFVIVPLYLN